MSNYAYGFEIKTIVDNNKKEYAVIDLDGGNPLDSSLVYVIDDSGKAILKMYIDETCGLNKLLGKGKEKYQDEDVYLWYKINNDVINYLEVDSDDYSEEEGYYINDKTKVISHEITIEDGKIVDKKTNEVFTISEISGANITFGVSIKTY